MKLLTWNINGLRATTFSGNFADARPDPVGEKLTATTATTTAIATEAAKDKQTIKPTFKTLASILSHLGADIVCFQEVKTPRDQLEESLALVPGFTSFFTFCQKRKNAAYSGVATFCRNSCLPFKVEEGLSDVLRNSASTTTTTSSEESIGHYGDLSGFSREELKGK